MPAWPRGTGSEGGYWEAESGQEWKWGCIDFGGARRGEDGVGGSGEWKGCGDTWVGRAPEASDDLWDEEEDDGDEEGGEGDDVGGGLVVERGSGCVVVAARVRACEEGGGGGAVGQVGGGGGGGEGETGERMGMGSASANGVVALLRLTVEGTVGKGGGADEGGRGWWVHVCVRVGI